MNPALRTSDDRARRVRRWRGGTLVAAATAAQGAAQQPEQRHDGEQEDQEFHLLGQATRLQRPARSATVRWRGGGTATVAPELGYVEFAGWVPGGRQMLIAREARGPKGLKHHFEVGTVA